jgi:hypothetical protein
MEEKSFKEERIRKITQLYYSSPDIQKAIFEFCKNRETVPRYFEGFGKRPDSLEYPADIFQLVKKGATSFHCSEELWVDPLQISVDMKTEESNKLRIGWDLLIDIDSKYLDYSKIMADLLVKLLNFHGVKNIGIKFSGSKGFHLIIPWKAFPKEINNQRTSDMFPEWPRIIVKYLTSEIKSELVKEISGLEKKSKYIRDYNASDEVMPDLILVSPRHLFRAPYSLHEKTSLSSVVIPSNEIKNFDVKDADRDKVKIKNFIPNSKNEEAKELLLQALDWNRHQKKEEKPKENKTEFKQIKLEKISDDFLPPSIQKILEGVKDGRKRALFILLNLFRSIGMEKEELEKRISEWNKKNQIQLKEGYIKAQLDWSYRNKVVLPPNFDKDYYKGIGIVPTEQELKAKNPVNWVTRKAFIADKKKDKKN